MNNYINPFVLETEEYKRDINVMKHYVDQTSLYLSKTKNISLEKARKYVTTQLAKGGRYEFKDPDATYLERENQEDRVKKVGGLWNYISNSIKNQEVIAPTLTTYIAEDKYKSIHALSTEDGIKLRNAAKKEMYVAMGNKDTELEGIKNTEQKSHKLVNNARSGAFCTNSTPIYNKTGHSSLTSNCRSTSGYGNANNEKFIAGNRHYYNYHIVMNNIISIVSNTNYDELNKVVNKYNLHIPTIEDVLECIKYSSRLYWEYEDDFNKIKELVFTLNDLERCAFVYTGDFYHLRKHNDEFTRHFLTRLASKITVDIEDPISTIKATDGDQLSLAHQICSNETMGKGKEYKDKFSKEDLNVVAGTCLNIKNTISDYSDFIKVFWVSDNVPASLSYFPSSIRRVALVSDTDSTIFTTQDWVKWYNNEVDFTTTARAIASSIAYLASSTITHILAKMSANFGVSKKNLYKIAMKNEYYFPVFIPTNLGKHYYGNIGCQEGLVYDKVKMEVKGVHIVSNMAPGGVATIARNMMTEITKDVQENMFIDINKYLKIVYDSEKKIFDDIENKGITYFKSSVVKTKHSYKNGENSAQYGRHVFWNEIFGPKYIMMPEPPYDVIKINVSLGSKTEIKEWLATIADETIRNKLITWVNTGNKNKIEAFYIPVECVTSLGIPEELKSLTNIRKIIRDNCNIFYIILETLGMYISGKRSPRLVMDDYTF